MSFNLNNLQLVEYEFLSPEHSWMPEVPLNSQNINIQYYREEFLGDFDLTITIDLPGEALLDTNKYKGWTYIEDEIENTGWDNTHNRYSYNDSNS